MALAVVAVLVGCGDGSEPEAESEAGPVAQADIVSGDTDDAVIDDLVVDADAVDDGGDAGDDDDAGAVMDDDGGDAGNTDAGAVIDDDAVDAGAVVVGEDYVVVDDGVALGLVVEGVCGWPGPVCVDGGVAPLDEGGRLWRSQGSSWSSWAGRVLDMCDDLEALVVIDGGGLRSGDDQDPIVPYVMERIVEQREFDAIVCSDEEAAVPRWQCFSGEYSVLREYLDAFAVVPEAAEVSAWIEQEGLSSCRDVNAERRRYVYVTAKGPMNPKASVEEAVEAYREKVESYASAPGDFAFDNPLGFVNFGWSLVVESPSDELVVQRESVSVVDGALRGLALNHSERLWARDVVVTATDAAGAVGVWSFPLAVQPGEPAPFEIEGWAGTGDVSEISFVVSADLSPRIDLSRSLLLWWHQSAVPRWEFLADYSEKMAVGEIPEGLLGLTTAQISREAPTSHPRLADAAKEQAIGDLRVYGALRDGWVVVDVFEVIPLADPFSSRFPEWVEVHSIPAQLPDGGTITEPTVGVLGATPMIWAGAPA